MRRFDQVQNRLARAGNRAFIRPARRDHAIERRRDAGQVNLDTENIGLRLGRFDSGQRSIRLGFGFIDRLLGGETLEDHPEKRFHGEIDRIYAQVRGDLLLRDGPRRLRIDAQDLPDTVLWNPGPDACAKLADMPADGWRHMLCVEGGRILEPITLAPGEDWTGRQSFTLEAM